MKINKFDGAAERRILTAMIVDDSTLANITAKWRDGMFSSGMANSIGKLCVEYFRKYEESPKQSISGLFESWADGKDKEVIKQASYFLESLSDEYEQKEHGINPSYEIDFAETWFNRVRMNRLADEIQTCIIEGKDLDALKAINSFSKIEMGPSEGIDLFQDRESVISAFNKSHTEPLIQYDGALGQFFGEQLCRNNFVAFMAAEGTGKSWMLLDIAYRAALNRKKVAFFDTGDMTQEQVIERFGMRAARTPMYSETGEWPYTVNWPTSFDTSDPAAGPSVGYKYKEYAGPLTGEKAANAFAKVQKMRVKSSKSYLKISCHANSTVSVPDIKTILESWAMNGWSPDVVVIDYADILAPIDKRNPDRMEQINASWKAMRQLSQELNVLVVTATQANREGYKAKTLRMEHTGEDKRKLAHVTAMVGINCNDTDKELGIVRLNYLKRRRGAFRASRCVYVAQCLPLAHPTVLSAFIR